MHRVIDRSRGPSSCYPIMLPLTFPGSSPTPSPIEIVTDKAFYIHKRPTQNSDNYL